MTSVRSRKPQPVRSHWIGAFLYLALVVGPSVHDARCDEISVVNSDGDEIAELASQRFSGVLCVSVSALTDLFDGKTIRIQLKYRYTAPTQALRLQFRRDDELTTVRLRVGSTRVPGPNGQTREMKGELREEDGRLWVPLDFVTDILPAWLPISVSYSSKGRRLSLVEDIEASPSIANEEDAAAAEVTGRSDNGSEGPYRATPVLPPVWEGMVVALDAGHGGRDVGVQANGLSEKDLAWEVVQRVQRLATAVKAKIVLTRTGDLSLSPVERAAVAAKQEANVLLSIHFNSSLRPDTSGYRVVVNAAAPAALPPSAARAGARIANQWAYLEPSRKLATYLHATLSEAGFLGQPPVELPIVLLQRVRMSAVHLELAYLSNKSEADQWRNKETLDRVAEAIWAALAQFRSE